MQQILVRASAAACAAVAVASLHAATAAAQDYRFDPLPSPPSFPQPRAHGINPSGLIVGMSERTAIAWPSPDVDAPVALPRGGFDFTSAFGVSDNGRIVGAGNDVSTLGDALLWAGPSAKPSVLRRGQFISAEARGVSASGRIVGTGFDADNRPVAVQWRNANAAPARLPRGAFTDTRANALNDAGEIVGSGFDGNAIVALRWPSPTAPPVALPGADFSFSEAMGINDRHEIVGNAFGPTSSGPTLWASPDSAPAQLFGPGFGHLAFGIDDLGRIVGHDGSNGVAELWESATSAPVALSRGYDRVDARGINDAGRVVGIASSPQTCSDGVFWPGLTRAPALLPRGDFDCLSAIDINNAGQIAGFAFVVGTGGVAIYWPRPTATPVALPRGPFSFPEAHGINDAGQIVGDGDGRPLLWANPSAQPSVLPDGGVPGGVLARGINNAGRIVGVRPEGPGSQRAVIWASPDAAPADLPAGATLASTAQGINDRGQIAGGGVTPDRGGQGVVWPDAASAPFALPFPFAAAVDIDNRGRVVSAAAGLWRPGRTVTLFLREQGKRLVLDTAAPAGPGSFRDSGPLRYGDGNPWRAVATWTQPPAGTPRTLTGAGPLTVGWSVRAPRDQGARFDLRADVLRDGTTVASGVTRCVSAGAPGEIAFHDVAFGVLDDLGLGRSDTLAVRLSARIGTYGDGLRCGRPATTAGLRVHFDNETPPLARLEVTST